MIRIIILHNFGIPTTTFKVQKFFHWLWTHIMIVNNLNLCSICWKSFTQENEIEQLVYDSITNDCENTRISVSFHKVLKSN